MQTKKKREQKASGVIIRSFEQARRRQAQNHAQTRQAHLSELLEDYVEIIAELISEYGEARVVDIAKCLGVTHVTVSRTITRLQRAGLVEAKPYRAIFLTSDGRKLAERSKRRHDAVVNFLRALGVSESTALRDAEGLEHHVSDETLAAFERLTSRKKPADRS